MTNPPRRRRLAMLLAASAAAAALLWSGLSLGPRSEASALTNCDVPSGVGLDTVEAQFLLLLNNYRTTNGLQPLTIDSRLNRAAVWLSNDMAYAGTTDHVDSLGRNHNQRIVQCGHALGGGGYYGEIIAWGYGSAESVFAAWQASPYGHNEAMLEPTFKSVGIGRTGPRFWTVDFATSTGDGISGEVPIEQTPTVATPSATATTVPPTATPTEPVWRSVAPGLARD